MQTQSNKIDFTGQNIYVGFDVHLKSWSVTIMTEKLTHKTFSQAPDPEVLYNYLSKTFPGANYYSAYEAGFCGYWIHNKLIEFGIKSMVEGVINMMMMRNKNLGMLLLAIWLIVTGLTQVVSIPIPSIGIIRAILAIAAGVLLLMGR